MNPNIIGLWPNLSRMYEIARLGKLAIKVVCEESCNTAMDDYPKIKAFYKKIDFTREDGLVFQLDAGAYNAKDSKYFETLEDIELRVKTAKQWERPTKYAKEESCKALLKTATEKLGWGLETIEKAEKLSGIIAQLGLSATIGIEHLAEAIQYYVLWNDDTQIWLEKNALSFGKGIVISRLELNEENIQKAIKYLKKRLKK